MPKSLIAEELRVPLYSFLNAYPETELLNAYLFFLERKYDLDPVLFVKEKMIYQNPDDAVRILLQEKKLWHETEIKITFGQESVNEQTTKIYICPFTGKVFGDNTHPNPQDAIYDWVSKCPENKERIGGLRVKRFFVSDDPGMIKTYIDKNKTKEPLTKVVYSSAFSSKLFSTQEAVIEDFKKHYLKRLSLIEVQNQNRYRLEEHLLAFIQQHLTEEKITAFVESISEWEEFAPFVAKWVE